MKESNEEKELKLIYNKELKIKSHELFVNGKIEPRLRKMLEKTERKYKCNKSNALTQKCQSRRSTKRHHFDTNETNQTLSRTGFSNSLTPMSP